MESYRVNIDSDNYFEADSILLQRDKRVVNIRSVHGRIGVEFHFLSDERLKSIVHDYPKTTDNVELLNMLSREYNGWNWFEAYDKSYNSNQEITKDELMDPSRMTMRDDGEISPSSQIVDVRRFIPEVRATKGRLHQVDVK